MTTWEMFLICAGIMGGVAMVLTTLHVIAEWLGYDLDPHYELEWRDDE